MKIFVDGDGCPVVDIAIEIAKKHGLEIVIVKNYNHDIWDEYATIVTVDQAPDSADYYIANNVTRRDIVITQDYGLAAIAIAKEAICLNQNGFKISPKNIDGLLERRHFDQEQRRKHKKYTKFKKRSPEQDRQFKQSLSKIIM